MHLFCKRCGRKLTSEVSRQRGYGSYCYKRSDEKRDKETEEQIKNEEMDNNEK